MNVADLFVNLGIKGTDQTVGALSGVSKELKNTASLSLEAKAAILGAMYATQRLFSESSQAGTNLTNFNSILGVSAKTLQQYQFAARQAGVSNQEVEGTFKALQGTMTKTLMGKGAPAGLAQVANLTGGITPDDIRKFAEQPQLLIKKLQEYAKKEKNAGLRNEVLRSFGVGDNFIAALNRNAFTDQQLAKAPTYSDSEIAALDKANIAWSNLGTKIQMAVGHFNAMHGGQLVKDIAEITDRVLKLADAFIKLADKLKIFQGIGKAFEGWKMIFDGISSGVDKISAAQSEGKSGVGELAKEASGVVGELVKGFIANKVIDAQQADRGFGDAGVFDSIVKDLFGEKAKPSDKIPEKAMQDKPGTQQKPIVVEPAKQAPAGLSPKSDSAAGNNKPVSFAPKPETLRTPSQVATQKPDLRLVPPPAPVMKITPNISPAAVPAGQKDAGSGDTVQNIEVNQTLNFTHDGADSKKTGESVKKAVQDAFRQRSAQMQVN